VDWDGGRAISSYRVLELYVGRMQLATMRGKNGRT
jgi:hypothetical protein